MQSVGQMQSNIRLIITGRAKAESNVGPHISK